MRSMQIDWMQLVYDIFKTVLIPLLGIGVSYLIYLIKTKVDQLKQNTDSEVQRRYLDLLEKYVIDAVVATNQTYVNALKEAGTFDLDAQKEAFRRTKDAVLELLTEDMKELLGTFVGDLDTYVNNLIESTVHYNREVIEQPAKRALHG